MFNDWTHAEVLQLITICATFLASTIAAIATTIGIVLMKKVDQVHIMINDRMSQMLNGAVAEGQLKEQAEHAARQLKPPPDV